MAEFHWPPLPPKPSRRSRQYAAWKRQSDARDVAFAQWVAQHRERISRQRKLFAENLGPARAALQTAMLDRAWALLDAGECEAADALLEFVPEKAADELLAEFFGDD